MELINTKDLYENDAFVIIEAEFEDSETKKRMQEISLGLKKRKERRTVRVYSLRTRALYTRPTP